MKQEFLYVFCIIIFFIIPPHCFHHAHPFNSILGQHNLVGSWKDGVLSMAAEAPGPYNGGATNPLVLAEDRTKRPDMLSRFHKYRGGWDIANKHYWASVGFTGAFGFILAVIWLVSFGIAFIVYHCCGWETNIKDRESHFSLRICFIMLIVFTCLAATGCIVLSVGQDEFHGEAVYTLDYVVNQSDYTVQLLRNVAEYMSLAKTVKVAQFFLTPDAIADIDRLNGDLNSAADTVQEKTYDNSHKIRRVFNDVRSALVVVATVMLFVSLLGLGMYSLHLEKHQSYVRQLRSQIRFSTLKTILDHPFESSIFGHQHAISTFSISGWLLVAVIFILCGVFVILNNAISDTCVAMGEWVDNPEAETALSNILPCVDERTTNQTLYKSKEVINSIVVVANVFIYSFANLNPPPQARPVYYNQSGPTLPTLCYPYNSQMQDQQCSDQDVTIANASKVWQNYTCTISPSGFCTSVGRLTPDMYDQLAAAVNISYALEHYAPPLLSLQNCDFVRDTFRNIITNHCPPLEHHLRTVNAGLVLIAIRVMLSLALWIFYASRHQREEVLVKIKSRIKESCKGKPCRTRNHSS